MMLYFSTVNTLMFEVFKSLYVCNYCSFVQTPSMYVCGCSSIFQANMDGSAVSTRRRRGALNSTFLFDS